MARQRKPAPTPDPKPKRTRRPKRMSGGRVESADPPNGSTVHTDLAHTVGPPVPADPPEYAPGNSHEIAGVVMSTIPPQDVRWLIHGFIPRGCLTLLCGPPSCGKSSLGAWLCLQARRPAILPGSEESVEVDLIPRLIEAGIDMSQALGLTTRRWSLPDDRDLLAATLLRWKSDFLWIDPIDTYVNLVHENDGDSVRAALEAFAVVAQRSGCAVVAARHPGKHPGNVCPGSRQWRAVPRMIWEMVPSPDDLMTGVIRPWKAYGGVSRLPRRYALFSDDGRPPVWEPGEVVGPVEAEALAITDHDDRRLIDQAMELLKALLAECEQESTWIYQVADREHLKDRCMRTALRRLGGTVRRQGVGKDHKSFWRLPHSGTLAPPPPPPPTPDCNS